MVYENVPGLYTIFHRKTGKFYIGSTSGVAVRLRRHRNMLDSGTHVNEKIQAIYDGWENLSVQVSYFDTVEDARCAEKTMLKAFIDLDNCMNIYSVTRRETKVDKNIVDSEVRNKISKAKLKRVLIDGKEYESVSAAASALGVTSGAITWGLNRGSARHAGWRYI